MSEAVFVLNAGSSSLKFGLFALSQEEFPRPLLRGQIAGLGTKPRLQISDIEGARIEDRELADISALDHRTSLAQVVRSLERHSPNTRVAAVGHRIVHGGKVYTGPIALDAAAVARLRSLTPLAPLHQPYNLDLVELAMETWRGVPQIGCFDTAFHAQQPAAARLFALPRRLTDAGIVRYGFHGLSYQWIAEQMPRLLAGAAPRRVIAAHLGSGASMCAMQAGRSVATTMGFTALDGLPMGTRCGALDAGVVLHLIQTLEMSADEVADLLYNQSGLLGVSGRSADMRTLLASDAGEAREAVDLFVYRAGRELGSLAAALGGIDALVFTAAIGERSAEIRSRICREAAWLDIALDEAANQQHSTTISAASSRVIVAVIPTNEESVIASSARELMQDCEPRQNA